MQFTVETGKKIQEFGGGKVYRIEWTVRSEWSSYRLAKQSVQNLVWDAPMWTFSIIGDHSVWENKNGIDVIRIMPHQPEIQPRIANSWRKQARAFVRENCSR